MMGQGRAQCSIPLSFHGSCRRCLKCRLRQCSRSTVGVHGKTVQEGGQRQTRNRQLSVPVRGHFLKLSLISRSNIRSAVEGENKCQLAANLCHKSSSTARSIEARLQFFRRSQPRRQTWPCKSREGTPNITASSSS